MTSPNESPTADPFVNKVVLVTGAAHGLGAAVSRRLAELGARVVLADVDVDAGTQLATAIGGRFVTCDVRSIDDLRRAVAVAEHEFGGLDIAVLNAGVSLEAGVGEDFDVDRYRLAMGINLDGVVFGFHAALPALRRRGGGSIIATASMAGLAPTPFDPIYSANKSAVVGFVRSVGIATQAEGILVNAVCPAFADTRIVNPIRSGLADAGVPLLTVDEVAEVFVRALTSGDSGQCWWVQPGRTSERFAFRGAPGPRTSTGERAQAADPQTQLTIDRQRGARQDSAAAQPTEQT